ncbi:hypothetical protein DBZ36_02025 [Alginatibacterium sediminis]|uniref:GDYXXLXY protein n=1 Tax=Alginatibacterium sediminis TaxID=2164068 RepID=A0A420ELA1_9ALTE|nr:GDYXXLXY domain-containing protein [Alginatibacterium sediminis]RKF21449.1 hypothetical protein DBZ36_02025 [Alginatibacterium sediminis]
MNKRIAIAGLALILAFANWTIFQKEQHLENGETVYLKLAPVDPRSLMQGDYMALRYVASTQISQALAKFGRSKHDFAIFDIDVNGLASFNRLDDEVSLSANQQRIAYGIEAGQLRFASDAFFFQEGSAQVYEAAEYGVFSLSDNGQLVLIDLADDNFVALSKDSK